MAIAAAPSENFPTPKGKKPVTYRMSSSAYTGRAPRSMRDAFGCSIHDPLHAMPDAKREAIRRAITSAARVIGRFVARLFGR